MTVAQGRLRSVRLLYFAAVQQLAVDLRLWLADLHLSGRFSRWVITRKGRTLDERGKADKEVIKIFCPQPSAQVVVADPNQVFGLRRGHRLEQPYLEANNESFGPWDEARRDVIFAPRKIELHAYLLAISMDA